MSFGGLESNEKWKCIKSEGEEDMVASSGEEKVEEKEVMHNMFHFYDEDESGSCVDENISDVENEWQVLMEGGVKIATKGNEVKSNFDECFDEVENDEIKPFLF